MDHHQQIPDMCYGQSTGLITWGTDLGTRCAATCGNDYCISKSSMPWTGNR